MEYLIKRDKHRSCHSFKLFYDCKRMTKLVTFTDSCIYKFGDVDDLDINKLFGFSFGYHQTDSVRFGWHPTTYNKIEIFAYIYSNTKRIIQSIGEIDLNKEYKFEILLYNDSMYQFIILENERILFDKIVNRGETKHKIGYQLYPYFGGNRTAPHDIKIILKET